MFNIFTEILLIFTEAYIMDKRLKIAFFNDVFYPMVDGVVIVIDNYAKRLAKFADVTLFCPKPIEKSYDDSKYNFKVERCRRMKFFSYEYPIATIPFDPSFRKKSILRILTLCMSTTRFSSHATVSNMPKKITSPL